MRSILERLLVFLSPLFAAAAAGKKPVSKKTKLARRASKPARPRSASKISARATKHPAPKSKTPARGTTARGKGQEPEAKRNAAKVAAPPLPKPPPPFGRAILLSPENGKYADSVTPKFRWLSVGGATRYEVVWSEDPGFAGAHSMTSLATEAAVPAERPLRAGAAYSWRVRGGNEGGWGPWSLPAAFQVLEGPPTP